MIENQRPYATTGYRVTGRGIEAGFQRIFMHKQLDD